MYTCILKTRICGATVRSSVGRRKLLGQKKIRDLSMGQESETEKERERESERKWGSKTSSEIKRPD